MGSIVKSIGKAISSVVKGVVKFVKKYWKAIVIAVVVAAVVIVTMGAGAPIVAGAAGAAAPAAGAAGAAAPALLGPTAGANAAIAGGSTVTAVAGTGASVAPIAVGASEGVGTIGGVQGAMTPAAIAADGSITMGTSAVTGAEAATAYEAGLASQEMLAAENYVATSMNDSLTIAKGVGESSSSVTAATPASQAPKIAADGISQVMTDLSPAAQNSATATFDGLGIDVSGSQFAMTDAQAATAQASLPQQSLLGKAGATAKNVAKTATSFAKDHPYLTYMGMQTLGGMLKEDPNKAKERQVALQAGMASPEGQVWDGNQMVDYKDSAIASQEFKQRAGVAPITTTPTPQAELPAPAGLINPPAPATVSVADPNVVNQGLLGNVKITGT